MEKYPFYFRKGYKLKVETMTEEVIMEKTTLAVKAYDSQSTTNIMPSKTRVLVVEDDVTSQPIWEYIINRADKHAYFDWATSATEAERKIEDAKSDGWKYNLIISDIFLSGSKTGLDLWQRYQSFVDGKMLLVSSIDHMKMAKFMSGNTATPIYIKKPLILKECIEIVYEILNQKTF